MFIASMRARRRGSTKGPFFKLLLTMTPYDSATSATTDDETARGLLLAAGAMALGRHAPGGDRVTTSGLVLALAAAVRMVDRVHNRTADRGANAHPALAAGLADLDVGVLGVAHLADGGAAGDEHAAHLGRGHAQDGVALPSLPMSWMRCRRNADSGALARLQLHVVDQRTDGDVRQRQSVARLDVGFRTGDHDVAHLQALRVNDVALLAVNVVQQSDTGRAVGIVLDGGNFGGHAVLVALEVDDAVALLVAAALVTGGDAAIAVATGLRLRGQKRLLRLDVVISEKSETV